MSESLQALLARRISLPGLAVLLEDCLSQFLERGCPGGSTTTDLVKAAIQNDPVTCYSQEHVFVPLP